MHAQPGDRKCSQPAIGGNHYGPVLIYMAKVSDAKTAKSGSFFKVAEDGYTGTTASWGTEILNANCGKRAFTVPKSLAAGDYLVRAEAIALHAGAGNPVSSQYVLRSTNANNLDSNLMSHAFKSRLPEAAVRTHLAYRFLVLINCPMPSSPRPSTTPVSSTSALDLPSGLVKTPLSSLIRLWLLSTWHTG